MNAQPDLLDEFCPCCGRWVARLDHRTGWCPPCAASTPAGTTCNRCGRPKPANHYSTKHWLGVCRSCRNAPRQAWRQANPDRERAYEDSRNARRRAERAAL